MAECQNGMGYGDDEGQGWRRGGCFDVLLWQHLIRPHVIKTQGSSFSDDESIQLGAARALGKAAINKCISMSQPIPLGGANSGLDLSAARDLVWVLHRGIYHFMPSLGT